MFGGILEISASSGDSYICVPSHCSRQEFAALDCQFIPTNVSVSPRIDDVDILCPFAAKNSPVEQLLIFAIRSQTLPLFCEDILTICHSKLADARCAAQRARPQVSGVRPSSQMRPLLQQAVVNRRIFPSQPDCPCEYLVRRLRPRTTSVF